MWKYISCLYLHCNVFFSFFSQTVEKSNRLSEKELAEAASKWAAEKLEKADENNLPERTEYEVRQKY